jgi:hypothetical protein
VNKRQTVFFTYKKIASRHKKLPSNDERKLISLAKKGDQPAREKLLLHLVGFLIFRIETALSHSVVVRFGEDILQECIIFAMAKIRTYKVRFKNREGIYKSYCFSTYIWKGITGIMFLYLKRNSSEVGMTTENIQENMVYWNSE